MYLCVCEHVCVHMPQHTCGKSEDILGVLFFYCGVPGLKCGSTWSCLLSSVPPSSPPFFPCLFIETGSLHIALSVPKLLYRSGWPGTDRGLLAYVSWVLGLKVNATHHVWPLLLFEAGSQWSWSSLILVDWLASQLKGSFCLGLLNTVITGMCTSVSNFYLAQIQVIILVRQVLHRILSSPITITSFVVFVCVWMDLCVRLEVIFRCCSLGAGHWSIETASQIGKEFTG